MPDFYIAESVAVWGTLEAVNGWVLQARMRRYSNLGLPLWQLNNIDHLTQRFHDLVVKTYNDTYGPPYIFTDDLNNGLLSPEQRANLVQARRDAKNLNMATEGWFFDHRGELATATRVPTFELKHRCYKCRALFRYDIVDGAENNGDAQFNNFPFPEKACGEVLCHGFCTAELNRIEAAREAEEQAKMPKKKRKDRDPGKGGGDVVEMVEVVAANQPRFNLVFKIGA